MSRAGRNARHRSRSALLRSDTLSVDHIKGGRTGWRRSGEELLGRCMADDDVREARARANALRENLPRSIEAAALGVKEKAPFQLLCAREALIWRTEELARTCCDALERDDFAAAALLSRAAVESTALIWKLMEVLDDRQKLSAEKLNDSLIRMLVGSRIWPDGPQALQILTCIDRMDKKVPGVRKSYDMLSEIAHPNWRGVFGMYGENDEPRFTANFGRGLRPVEHVKSPIVNALLGALGLFEYAYNRISDEMPGFLSELSSIWPEEQDDAGSTQ